MISYSSNNTFKCTYGTSIQEGPPFYPPNVLTGHEYNGNDNLKIKALRMRNTISSYGTAEM